MKYEEKPTVFTGMPSLLSFTPFPYFYNNWPLSLELPPLKGSSSKENDELIQMDQLLQHKGQKLEFEPREQMQVTQCEHKDRKHYAKNMCSTCYQNERKRNKRAQCVHTDRVVFARNMCCSCYSKEYKKHIKNKRRI